MKLEDQVVSLPLSKQLKELGLKQDSLFWYSSKGRLHSRGEDVNCDCVYVGDSNFNGEIAAFTTSELGEILPDVLSDGSYLSWESGMIGYKEYDCWNFEFNCQSESDARAKLLIYLIEEGIITPKDD